MGAEEEGCLRVLKERVACARECLVKEEHVLGLLEAEHVYVLGCGPVEQGCWALVGAAFEAFITVPLEHAKLVWLELDRIWVWCGVESAFSGPSSWSWGAPRVCLWVGWEFGSGGWVEEERVELADRNCLPLL
jgi:hypothetical protein